LICSQDRGQRKFQAEENVTTTGNVTTIDSTSEDEVLVLTVVAGIFK